MTKLRLIIAMSLYLTVFGSQAAELFRIGEKAPELKVGRWLNQGPITSFEPGHIYVVEFWATWCGPCKAAMPHLSELAKKYEGKVTIIGADILERTADPRELNDQLDRFMKGGGKAMQYPVCQDTHDQRLAKEWFERTGSIGIPATVVVDGQGNIAAMPGISTLEETLEQLIAGTYDYQAAAAARDARVRRQAEAGDGGVEALKAIGAALQNREWTRAIELIDTASQNNPRHGGILKAMRYQAMLHINEDEAFRMAQEAQQQHKALLSYVGTIAKSDGLSKRMYQLVITTLEGRAVSPAEKLDLAAAYFKLDQPAKAVPLQREVVEWARATDVAPTYLDPVEEDLKKYEAAAAAVSEAAR